MLERMMLDENFRALLDQAPKQVDVRALDRAVTACNETVSDTESEIERLERAINAQRELLAEQRRDRDLFSNYRAVVLRLRGLPTDSEASATTSEQTEQPTRTRSARGAKRSAILDYLSDGAERTKDEIRQALITAGVMGDVKDEIHSLNVTLSRMFRRHELARPRVGVYKLPSDNPDGTPTTSQEVLDA
jgi:hypothetical protein